MNPTTSIESEIKVKAYISSMGYALENGAKIIIQFRKKSEYFKKAEYSNDYTIRDLFPDENPSEALRRELKTLKADNYIHTVTDVDFPDRSEMRVFGKKYGTNDVYIKVRSELLNAKSNGEHTVFVMSFHYAEKKFADSDFPYCRKGDDCE